MADNKDARRVAQDIALAGAAVRGAGELYKTAKPVLKKVKKKIVDPIIARSKIEEGKIKTDLKGTLIDKTILAAKEKVKKGISKVTGRKYHNNTYEEGK